VEFLAQSPADFALTYNFQGTHILGVSRGYLCDSVASCNICYTAAFSCLAFSASPAPYGRNFRCTGALCVFNCFHFCAYNSKHRYSTGTYEFERSFGVSMLVLGDTHITAIQPASVVTNSHLYIDKTTSFCYSGLHQYSYSF